MRTIFAAAFVSLGVTVAGCGHLDTPLAPSAVGSSEGASAISGAAGSLSVVATPTEFEGSITALNLSQRTMNVGLVLVSVPVTAEISRGAVAITFAALAVGDNVRVHALVTGPDVVAREVAVIPSIAVPPVVGGEPGDDNGSDAADDAADDAAADAAEDAAEHRNGEDRGTQAGQRPGDDNGGQSGHGGSNSDGNRGPSTPSGSGTSGTNSTSSPKSGGSDDHGSNRGKDSGNSGKR